MTTGHFGCPWCHLWDKWWECIGCASAFEWIFFDIPQAKNHQSHHWCQDQGEVLSCWHHSRFLGPFGSCVQLVPTLLASQRHVADFLHGQKSVRRGFSSCYKHGFQNQLLSCVGAMISARMRKKLLMGVGGWGGGVWGLRRSWEGTHFAKIYFFVLSQQGCEVTWHSQRRNATKACTGFVADSVSAWPYGLLCVRGDLANPEHDAICQIRPFLLQYLCNTPFMYPQQMADHLRVLSFWKKLSLLCCGFCCCFFFFPDTALFFLMSEVNAVRRSMPGINFGRGHALLTAVDVSCKNACGCVFL